MHSFNGCGGVARRLVTDIGEPQSGGEDECLQLIATVESELIDVFQRRGKCDLDEALAAAESRALDSGKRGWEGELDEALAISKGGRPDGHGGGEGGEIEMGDGGTGVKGLAADRGE